MEDPRRSSLYHGDEDDNHGGITFVQVKDLIFYSTRIIFGIWLVYIMWQVFDLPTDPIKEKDFLKVGLAPVLIAKAIVAIGFLIINELFKMNDKIDN